MERIKKAINDVSKNKEFALKIQNDDNTFIIKIINKSNKIIFEVLNINDDGQEYYQEYKIDDFRINHSYFNRFNDINDLYKELFIKLKSRDILISQKNENEIIVKIYIFFLKKKEEIQFIIKKNTNTNKLFYVSYNNNRERSKNFKNY